MIPYKYIDINFEQVSKKTGSVCGDFFDFERTKEFDIFVLADGMGSGVKANIFANMAVARFMELIRRGFSFHSAFESVVKTMHQARTVDTPFAAITATKVLNNGYSTILSYEMPVPIMVHKDLASAMEQRHHIMGGEPVEESNIYLEQGDRIIVTSDGVTQSGLGDFFKNGWGTDGVLNFINTQITKNCEFEKIPQKIIEKSLEYYGEKKGDDISVLDLFCKNGNAVSLFTGPPVNPEDDGKTVRKFMSLSGKKIVCGSTTAKIVSSFLGRETTTKNPDNVLIPVTYYIDGIDLVTEGAVTLNQLYNILDDDYKSDIESGTNGVLELLSLLKSANKITFFVGRKENPGHKDPIFKQIGVLPRNKIMPLIINKLRNMGKLVIVEYI